MAEKRRFKAHREFKKRLDEQEENAEGDIRSFTFHSLERQREALARREAKEAKEKEREERRAERARRFEQFRRDRESGGFKPRREGGFKRSEGGFKRSDGGFKRDGSKKNDAGFKRSNFKKNDGFRRGGKRNG